MDGATRVPRHFKRAHAVGITRARVVIPVDIDLVVAYPPGPRFRVVWLTKDTLSRSHSGDRLRTGGRTTTIVVFPEESEQVTSGSDG